MNVRSYFLARSKPDSWKAPRLPAKRTYWFFSTASGYTPELLPVTSPSELGPANAPVCNMLMLVGTPVLSMKLLQLAPTLPGLLRLFQGYGAVFELPTAI